MTQESLLSAHRLSVRLVPGGDRSAPGPLSKGHNPACTASYRLHHLKFNHKTHFSKDLGTPCFSLNSFRLGSGAEGRWGQPAPGRRPSAAGWSPPTPQAPIACGVVKTALCQTLGVSKWTGWDHTQKNRPAAPVPEGMEPSWGTGPPAGGHNGSSRGHFLKFWAFGA